MKNGLIFVVVLSLVLLAGCGKTTDDKSAILIDKTKNTEKPLGSDKDEHGCIGSAGYTWCQASQKCIRVFEEFCPDSMAEIVGSIKKVTGVALSAAGEREFNWIASEGETTTDVNISGISYTADNISLDEYLWVEKYLASQFEADSNNLADGPESGLRGYYADYMVCDWNFQRDRNKKTGARDSASESLAVRLDCGYFNKNDVPALIAAQQIKEVLAEKYRKAVSEISVKVRKSDGTHAAGSVSFSKDSKAGGGVFLAVKADRWQVIYDGNGSIDCESIRRDYKFPDDILKPNFCD